MSAVDAAQGNGATPNTVNAVETRTLPVDELNKLVGGARIEGEKRATEALKQEIAAMQQQIASLTQGMGMNQQGAPGQASTNANPQDAGMPDVSELVKQEMLQQQQAMLRAEQRRQAEELLQKFNAEMQRGVEGAEDFKEVTSKYNPYDFAEITMMAAQLDNVPEVMYELNKNPMKLAYISELVRRSPQFAFEEMKNLSKSIKEGQDAKAKFVDPIKPLAGIKASTAGTDNGKRTVKDWKKFYSGKR